MEADELTSLKDIGIGAEMQEIVRFEDEDDGGGGGERVRFLAATGSEFRTLAMALDVEPPKM